MAETYGWQHKPSSLFAWLCAPGQLCHYHRPVYVCVCLCVCVYARVCVSVSGGDRWANEATKSQENLNSHSFTFYVAF